MDICEGYIIGKCLASRSLPLKSKRFLSCFERGELSKHDWECRCRIFPQPGDPHRKPQEAAVLLGSLRTGGLPMRSPHPAVSRLPMGSPPPAVQRGEFHLPKAASGAGLRVVHAALARCTTSRQEAPSRMHQTCVGLLKEETRCLFE